MPMMMWALGAAGLMFAAAPALVDSPFDGTWKVQTESMKAQGRPDRFQIRDGIYSCATCTPAYSVPADGAFHRVAGKDYWDEVAVTVDSDRQASFRYKKGDAVIANVTEKVSADGNSIAVKSHNTNNAGGVPVDADATMTRVGAPVTGAHLLSGEWRQAAVTSMSDSQATMTMKLDGKAFHLTTPIGETLDATVGGSYAPNVGDPGKTMTKVEQLGPRTLRLTDMRAGKLVNVSTYVVSNDGGSIAASSRDPQTGQTYTATAVKQ